MDLYVHYKTRIDDLLIKGKKYRDPNFSAQTLAEMLEVSASKLSRIIKEEYGTSYTNIVHGYRVQDAKRYLKDARMLPYSVDDIGALVGFKNRQSFFNAFRKATGTTPERFRRAESLRKTID
ncbi:MAG: helix-turn-helix domain-containing protein [Bacteroidaceae bacterium]|nr:helix-turn-helix domain-containing protein [Bacteroidaceae bacterium]